MQEALYYRREGDRVSCQLCPQECRLKEGHKGLCGVRIARGGRLLTSNYYHCGAFNVDPIEKKPLYHFYPGWDIISLGTIGCNLHCQFCQNWNLAHGDQVSGLEVLTTDKLLQMLRNGPAKGQLGIAYTYNEPTVWYEFVLENSRLVAAEGYKNVLVTNGMINPEPLAELLPYIHAMNIDVKAFHDDFYQRYCRGTKVQHIQRTVEQAAKSCHVELTYLLISTLNDDVTEIGRFVDWVATLDPQIPVHFSRFFPAHRLDLPPTSIKTMIEAYEQARKQLSYVYLGNVMDKERSSTYCPNCGNLLIVRRGYGVDNPGLNGKNCNNCGYQIRLAGHMFGEEEQP